MSGHQGPKSWDCDPSSSSLPWNIVVSYPAQEQIQETCLLAMLSKEGTAMVLSGDTTRKWQTSLRGKRLKNGGAWGCFKEEQQLKNDQQEVFVEMPGGVYAVKVEKDSEEWKKLRGTGGG